jgi:hypothetical protein
MELVIARDVSAELVEITLPGNRPHIVSAEAYAQYLLHDRGAFICGDCRRKQHDAFAAANPATGSGAPAADKSDSEKAAT